MEQYKALLCCMFILFLINFLTHHIFVIKYYNKSCKQINQKFEEQEQHIKALEEQLNNK